MAAELLSFFRPAAVIDGDWSSQEIAEFYRVEAALVQAGVRVFVDRGVTDEGDPWFVFCRATDGEVIVHFARISGNYLIAAESIGAAIRGPDFRRALADFVSTNPTLIPLRNPRGAKLMLHPASLLAAVVATALYHMSGTEAVASSLDPIQSDGKHSGIHETLAVESSSGVGFHHHRKWGDWQVAAVVSAMIALAATDRSDPTEGTESNLASKILDVTHDHLVLPHSVVADASPISELDGSLWTARSLEASDAHNLFNNFIFSGNGQTVSQQFQISSTEGMLQKGSTPAVASSQETANGEHWWTSLLHGGDNDFQHLAWTDTSSSFSGDANAKGADQIAVLTGPSGQGAVTLSVADSNHSGSQGGSSSPDHPLVVPEQSDAQAAIVYVNNELIAANKIVSQINLGGNLSVQDVISHGVSDVFGFAVLSPAVETGGHNDVVGVGQLAPTAIVSASSNPVVSQSSAPLLQGNTFEAFNAAANEILDAFVRQNTFEVLTSNNNVVLFDTNAADFSSPDLSHRTWSMFDGSTISIVGILPHTLAVLA